MSIDQLIGWAVGPVTWVTGPMLPWILGGAALVGAYRWYADAPGPRRRGVALSGARVPSVRAGCVTCVTTHPRTVRLTLAPDAQ